MTKICKSCICSKYNIPKEVLENYIQSFMAKDMYSVQMYTFTMLTYCPDDKKRNMAEEIDLLLQEELGDHYEELAKYHEGWG